MSKQRVVNNGPNIKNGGIIGKGPKATPVDGSWVKGVKQQMAEQAKINAAQKPAPKNQQAQQQQKVVSSKKGISL